MSSPCRHARRFGKAEDVAGAVCEPGILRMLGSISANPWRLIMQRTTKQTRCIAISLLLASGALLAAPDELPPEQQAFWERFQALCGQAFAGEVSDVTPYYADGVVGSELRMQVMQCETDRIHAPFQGNL